MIYPDLSLSHQVCPICDHKLLFRPTQVAKIYNCVWNNIRSVYGHIPHYEFLRYKDNSVATNYVFEDWWVMSDEEYSTVNLILRDKHGYVSGCSELGYRKSPMLLGCDNLDKIKKKLILFNLFY